MSKTIVLIHGAWMTPASFENFRGHYESRGHIALAPAWPLLDRPIDALRTAPDRELGRLTLGRIVDHYAAIIGALAEPPILVGHSYGGLVVQMLLDRGYGASGVSIAPAPAAGILAGPKALRSALPVFLAWRGWSRALTMTFRQFAWSVGNNLDPIAQQRAYDAHVVPAPGRLYYQSVLGIGSGIRWKNPDRAPLLLVAGGADHTVEPPMVRQQYMRYRQSTATTDLAMFPDLSHFLIAEPGWEAVADAALDWALTRAVDDATGRPVSSTTWPQAA